LAKSRLEESPYRERRTFVSAAFDKQGATYVIRDQGPGFDPHSLPDPRDPANLDRPCGRGVLLMKTFMDEVKFSEAGNQVTMIKRASESQVTETVSVK